MLLTNKNSFLPRKVISNNAPFEIQTLAAYTAMHDVQDHEKGYINDYYEIIWMESGTATLFLNLEQISIMPGTIICLKPGQCQRFEASADADGYVVAFDESFFGIGDQELDASCRSALMQLFESNKGLAFSDRVAGDMEEVLAKMMREFSDEHPFRNEILRRYLRVFFVYLAREFEQVHEAGVQRKTIKLVERFFALLSKDFGVKKNVSYYAGLLSVTPNYLNEMVKRSTGYSAGFHIRQRVILEIKRMVAYSDVCTKEIAYYLGFSDMGHFSKFFKQNSGMNYSDFRKTIYIYPGADRLVRDVENVES